MRPSKGIINMTNLKIMFIWPFNRRNQIYRKCKKCNASVSIHGRHAKVLRLEYSQQVFSPPFDMSSQHKCE